MYKFFQKYKCVNMVSQKMQISQIPSILSNKKKKNNMLTIKLPFAKIQ